MAKVLLDTNILIHREAAYVAKDDIGVLFRWLDQLRLEKWIHKDSIEEIKAHKDARVVAAFMAKLMSYHCLQTIAPETEEIHQMRVKFDRTANDAIDSNIVKEVFHGRVDYLITEDNGIHQKAQFLGIEAKVFKINEFLEKVISENPDLVDYKTLAVRKERFGNINLHDPFFDSFRQDYPGFDAWFNKKSEETAYICQESGNEMLAFLYLKREDEQENYSDMEPRFEGKKRLKIGTFKVALNGYKLGERFLKIIFDNAMRYAVDEIYVTVFDRTDDQKRLILLLEEWGFRRFGLKHTKSGDELVYIRRFDPHIDATDPRTSFPYVSGQTNKFIVSIYPEYHTELLPDSFLRTEFASDYVENRPYRNALSKVYVSRSIERNLKSGDLIVFYRTKVEGQAAHYSAVATTLGVVQEVHDNITSLVEFIALCRKRSVFSDEELKAFWDYNLRYRPFIINFLYVLSFPHRLTRAELLEFGIIDESRIGITPLSDDAFNLLMEKSNADKRYIVD